MVIQTCFLLIRSKAEYFLKIQTLTSSLDPMKCIPREARQTPLFEKPFVAARGRGKTGLAAQWVQGFLLDDENFLELVVTKLYSTINILKNH